MSYHRKLQTLKNGTADREIQQWAYLQLSKESTDLDIALSYIKQYELEIARLKQEVAFLEDWRAVWAPVVRQHQGVE
jgi:hypothetical protein